MVLEMMFNIIVHYNVEQVEILRGPNALLFGRGGTGGALNRVTKKAMVGDDFRTVNVGMDSFGAFDLAADINMDMGDTMALRINVHSDTLAVSYTHLTLPTIE